MSGVLGLGNALVDVMTMLPNDDVVNNLGFPKGSMQLVDLEFSEKVQQQTKRFPVSQASGGSSANTIHGLARLGISTSYIGKVGPDDLGRFFSEDLVKSGIKPCMLHSQTPTGRAVALVTPDSERTFATYLGAAVELHPDDLKDEYFEGYDYFHFEGYLVFNHDLMIAAAQKAKKHGMKVSLDMASFNVVELNLDFLKTFIPEYVDIVFANEEEARAYMGHKEALRSLHEISQQCEIAVVKTGNRGSLVKKDDIVYRIGVIDAKPIDTTGAGDLYASGFLYGLCQGLPLDQCGKAGALLAGKVIEEVGAKVGEDKWNRIREMVKTMDF
jgi:sugar/nucleoside kinase (ribokinase family)